MASTPTSLQEQWAAPVENAGGRTRRGGRRWRFVGVSATVSVVMLIGAVPVLSLGARLTAGPAAAAAGPAAAAGSAPSHPELLVSKLYSRTVAPVHTDDRSVGDDITLQEAPERSIDTYLVASPDAKTAYVVGRWSGGNDVGVWPIDTATGTSSSRSVVGGGTPMGAAVTPDGSSLWLTAKQSNGVSLVQKVTLPDLHDQYPAVPVYGASGVAINPDGRTVYVGGLDRETRQPQLFSIDTATKQLSPVSVPIAGRAGQPPSSIALTPDGARAFVMTPDAVTPVDLRTMTAGLPIQVRSGFSGMSIAMAPTGQYAYAYDINRNGIVPINTTTGATGSTISIPHAPSHPRSIAIAPGSNEAYVGLNQSDEVAVLDLVHGTFSGIVRLAGPAGGEAVGGLVMLPDQAPTASFSWNARGSYEVSFNADSSRAPVGAIASYSWDFGDGTKLTTHDPAVSHTYSSFGLRNVTLTVSDAAGTSTTKTFTGQTMSNNGGPTATTSQSVMPEPLPTVTAVVPPSGPVTGGTRVTILGSTLKHAISVSFGGRRAKPLSSTDNSVTVVAPPVGARTSVPVSVTTLQGTSLPTTYFGYAGLPPTAFAATGLDAGLVPVNLGTGKAGGPVSLNGRPTAVAVTPDGERAFVAEADSDTVAGVDLVTGKVFSRTDVGSQPISIAVTPDGRTAYVVSQGDNNIIGIDAVKGTLTDIIDVGPHPTSIAFTPDSTLALVAHDGPNGTGAVTPIFYHVHLPDRNFTVPAHPVALGITPDGSTAVVASSDGVVQELNVPSRGLRGGQIKVGGSLSAVAVSPDGTTAYVADETGNQIVAIDLRTGTLGARIPVGKAPSAIAVAADGKTAYVANRQSRDITPVDLATGTALPSIKVNGFPSAIALEPDQAPTASFSVTRNKPGKAQFTFDASASGAPVGGISTYAWDFGDGSSLVTKQPVVQHTYSDSAGHTVRVTVTDTAGTSSSQVFTGQDVLRVGGPSASQSQQVPGLGAP